MIKKKTQEPDLSKLVDDIKRWADDLVKKVKKWY